MRVRLGNETMEATNFYLECFKNKKKPALMENGINSMIWFAPPIKKRLKKECVAHTGDYCLCGMAFRKRTRFATWNVDPSRTVTVLNKRCSSKKGICDRTGQKHIRLKGRDKEGQWMTRSAEAYPWPIAKAIAALLVKK